MYCLLSYCNSEYNDLNPISATLFFILFILFPWAILRTNSSFCSSNSLRLYYFNRVRIQTLLRQRIEVPSGCLIYIVLLCYIIPILFCFVLFWLVLVCLFEKFDFVLLNHFLIWLCGISNVICNVIWLPMHYILHSKSHSLSVNNCYCKTEPINLSTVTFSNKLLFKLSFVLWSKVKYLTAYCLYLLCGLPSRRTRVEMAPRILETSDILEAIVVYWMTVNKLKKGGCDVVHTRS